ncbi:MAG: replication initiator RepC [Natronohydrobacter sp.]|nr:replication initiator RepC [Natronohydrobacter sp.]
MTFTKLSIDRASADLGGGNSRLPQTDIWVIFRALRDARCAYGLRSGHIQTLQALLSFLRPGQGETIFASNAEICRRIGGIDERTLRRHIDRFVDLGFVKRHDSPNGKRYRVRSSDGHCISFGLSIASFLERAEEVLAAAQEVGNMRRDGAFLRKQILVKLAQLEQAEPTSTFPKSIRKMLRRKLSVTEYQSLLAAAEEECRDLSTAVDPVEVVKLSANDGQNVRHQSKSEKEHIDLDTPEQHETPEPQELTAICDQATAFAPAALRSWPDIEHHARTLAPMMGIHASSFEEAQRTVGSRKASCAIFIMLQFGNRIRNFGAYFHSLTLGRRASEFNPKLVLERLVRSDAVSA